ncbi:MAG: hypothetical protein LBT48_07205 [Prevotellaceae bacterium]|jgi:hypothetical protein|nr:hypothetical protein [Prevotellaceae bacterium]
MKENNIVYAITEEDVQHEAIEQIGRKLNEEEMLLFTKRLHYGIGENMLFIWSAVFEEFKK